MAHYDDIKTQNVAIVGLIGAIVTFGIIVLLMVLYQGAQQRQEEVKQIDQPPLELYDLVAKEQAQLNNYRWIKEVDESGKKRDVYAVPIQRAMKLVAAEVAAQGAAEEKPARPPEAAPRQAPAGSSKGGKDDAKR